jgi:response regulator RpfG family c-di-GMP phosphodiesterase
MCYTESMSSARRIATQTVLIVDDDQSAIATVKALLAPLGHRVLEATNGQEALEAARTQQPDMMLLDVMMPDMSGFEVCETLRADPATRDLPVVMITALKEKSYRMRGLEAGADDFLSKPVDGLELRTRVSATLRADRHRRHYEEQVLHNATLKGTIAVMRDVLSMVDPDTFGRTQRLERMVTEIGTKVGYEPLRELELAAVLCQIGRVVLPENLRNKATQPSRLSPSDRKLLDSVSDVSATLIEHIPEFEAVGDIVAWQDKRYDGTGPPALPIAGEDLPLGARIIRLARDVLDFEDGGLNRSAALTHCHDYPGHHDPALLEAASELYAEDLALTKIIGFGELKTGCVTRSAILGKDGRRLLAAGMEITIPLLASLETYNLRVGLMEPFEVSLPPTDEGSE